MPAAPNYGPKWAVQATPELIAAMFAGAWVETSTRDQEIIGTLAGCTYEQVEAVLAPLATAQDGPLIRSGEVWKVVSLRDLWTQVGGQVTSTQLVRFEVAFHSVRAPRVVEVCPNLEQGPPALPVIAHLLKKPFSNRFGNLGYGRQGDRFGFIRCKIAPVRLGRGL